MTTINSAAIANSHIDGEIDMRRGNPLRSYFKRLARRQVRRRLDADLHKQMDRHLADAAEMRSMLRAAPATTESATAKTATIIAFPSQPQRHAREIPVIRKFARALPFERQQIEITVLAA